MNGPIEEDIKSTEDIKSLVETPDWEKLRMEFLQGISANPIEFLVNKGFEDPLTPEHLAIIASWKEARILYKRENKPVLTAEQKAVIANERHIKLSRKMQISGFKALSDINPKDAEEARKLIVSGILHERLALGMNRKGGVPSSLTQINLNFPKTKLDEILHGQDYKGVLKLIAELRRERSRRSRPVSPDRSKTETE